MSTWKLFLLALCCCAAWGTVQAAEEGDTQAQVAKMLLDRAKDEYEIVAKARAANRGLLERIEQELQPYAERRAGELFYNFRRAQPGLAGLREMQEIVDWHEKAVKRHFYLAEEGIKAGVKLNDALTRMDEFAPAEQQLEEE